MDKNTASRHYGKWTKNTASGNKERWTKIPPQGIKKDGQKYRLRE
jgi:hypothetical protein